MLLVAVLVVVAIFLSGRNLRKALPFESLLAVGATALVTLTLFEIDRLS